jgi:hypothetical protein
LNKILSCDATGLGTWTTQVYSSGEWTDAGTHLYPTTTHSVYIGGLASVPGTPIYNNRLRVYAPSSTAAVATFQNEIPLSTSTGKILDLDFGSTTSVGTSGNYIRFIWGFGSTNIVGNINQEVVYNPFTGAHCGQSEEETSGWLTGMIVSSAGSPVLPNMGNALPQIRLSKSAYDKTAIGTYAGAEFPHKMENMDPAKPVHRYCALGDGVILVTDLGGDIEIGDYITSSSIPGYGMKQNNDMLNNYTVAKSVRSVKWDAIPVDPKLGFKWKLIDCTYHGG